MTPAEFIAKWTPVQLPERAASQEHFLDLCHLLGQPTPAAADATGAEYTFEKSVAVTGPASRGSKGHSGVVDVWRRGKFAWEYKRKGKYKDLTEAYRQLNQYREALENPPLLVVSDIARIEIHTNFTAAPPRVYAIALEELASHEKLELLRRVFEDPDALSPTLESRRVTEEVARRIGAIADTLRPRTGNPQAAAHFLMKCMFCLFAEDVELLPAGLFGTLIEKFQHKPRDLARRMTDLFDKMRLGGDFGTETIPWFDGGLFDEAPALELSFAEIATLMDAARENWAKVAPSIFGTLFERCLNPEKRAQIGAHYTSPEDILLVVQPVVMQPLRREWAEVRQKVGKLLVRRQSAKTPQAKSKAANAVNDALQEFDHRLASIRILDAASGSGNFLYMAIQQLLELEREVVEFAAEPEIGLLLAPRVHPRQLAGVELDPFAAELAQVVIWIGYLQWMHDYGFAVHRDPILDKFQNIECRDAILDLSDPKHPAQARWPEADFIIGNPPFLGSKLFRRHGLPEDYVAAMYAAYDLPKTSDLCCYWFEQARRAIQVRPSLRAGLLATQGIRGGANREVLERIRKSGDIFMAWSDRDWILDGANVHVSMVGFDAGSERDRKCDGRAVPSISASLAAGVDLTQAMPLLENAGIAFVGACKKGKFEVSWNLAREFLAAGGNPNGRPNSDVLTLWLNGIDIVRRYEGDWIVDFGVEENLNSACRYEKPFEHVRQHVRPARDIVRNEAERRRWWLLARPAPDYRKAVAGLPRYIVVPQVAKHRLFAWMGKSRLASHQLTVISKSDDYTFGVLQSAIHEMWSLRMGTQLEDRPRYTPTTCFETFPLPWPPGSEPAGSPLCQRIAAAAQALNEQRERWLNPPEWIDPIARSVDLADTFADVPAEARPLIRESAIMAIAARDPNLRKRTLTNLYNERPTWLVLAHAELDRAVLAAYAAVDPEGAWSEDWADVWRDSGAGQPLAPGHTLAARRAEIDERVLANLLRLNLARAR